MATTDEKIQSILGDLRTSHGKVLEANEDLEHEKKGLGDEIRRLEEEIRNLKKSLASGKKKADLSPEVAASRKTVENVMVKNPTIGPFIDATGISSNKKFRIRCRSLGSLRKIAILSAMKALNVTAKEGQGDQVKQENRRMLWDAIADMLVEEHGNDTIKRYILTLDESDVTTTSGDTTCSRGVSEDAISQM